jgi:hypothetical protein
MAMPGFEVTEIALWQEGAERWRSLRARAHERGTWVGAQTNALSPVMALPTIKVFISRVPSYE